MRAITNSNQATHASFAQWSQLMLGRTCLDGRATFGAPTWGGGIEIAAKVAGTLLFTEVIIFFALPDFGNPMLGWRAMLAFCVPDKALGVLMI
jgi:hypothetical protein